MIADHDGDLLRVEDLRVWFGSDEIPIRAVDGVSFHVPRGRTVGLVGESGCGKTVTALSLARLVPPSLLVRFDGDMRFDGEDVLQMNKRRLLRLRGGEVAYVFQEPGTALNPVLTVGRQIMEALRLHRSDVIPREEAISLLRTVGIGDPEARLGAYPHELSGGMQQRVVIAMALACRPKMLVADEPTTALDVTIQAQILQLLAGLQERLHMATLLITHNLGLVAETTHLVNVMYAGRIVESGMTQDVLRRTAHPYTRGLLDAVPRLHDSGRELRGIEGTVPHPAELPPGCSFAPRCSHVQDICRTHEPEPTQIDAGSPEHSVRCHFPLNADGP